MSATRLVMCSEFQSRRITLPRQGARQLGAKSYGFEFDLGSLRTGQLLERCRSNDDSPVTVPAGPVQHPRRALNKALPDLRLFLLNNKTPDWFQTFGPSQ